METKKQLWIDILILLGMIVIVFLCCQPLGRKWNEKEKELYIGEEGEYSSDLDSYYYLRRAREFTEGGFSSIRLMYSRSEDPSITAVQSDRDDSMPMLLSAAAAVLWFALHAVGIDVGIYTVASGLCSFLLALFVVPVYLFLRKRMSRLPASFGALVTALLPPFFRHSMSGVFDTDALIGLLALILVLSLYECILSEKRGHQVRYGIIASVATILLYYTWTAFFIYAAIAVGTAVTGLFVRWLVRKRKGEKLVGMAVPIAFMGVILLISLILGGKTFYGLAEGFLVKGQSSQGQWPDVTKFISELKKPGFDESISLWYAFISVSSDYSSYYGGMLVLAFLIISAVVCLVKGIRAVKESKDNETIFLFPAIGIWLLGAVVMSCFGIRYMEFVALPAGLVMAFGMSLIEKRELSKEHSVAFVRLFMVGAGVIAFSCFVLAFPLAAVILAGVILVAGFFVSKTKNRYVIPIVLTILLLAVEIESMWLVTKATHPIINKSVDEASRWIRDNSEEDAVIADFWSLGYVYQYYGRRRTISDGGTYNGEFFYWLGTMVATDDPKLSAGIARMLQCCGVDGSEYVCTLFKTKKEACDFLKEILPLSRDAAKIYLEGKGILSETQIDTVLGYTHPLDCPDIYYVSNARMFRGLSALTYYRDWAFGEDEESAQASQTTYCGTESIAKPAVGQLTRGSMQNGDKDVVGVVLTAAEERVEGWILTPEGMELNCERAIYIKDGEKVYDKTDSEPTLERGVCLNTALLMFEEDGQISVVMCEASMPDSVLAQLYLFGGKDQDVFEKVYETDWSKYIGEKETRIQWQIGNNYYDGDISVWKIHFE